MEMEFGKGIDMEQSPNSVLPAPRPFTELEKRSTRLKPPRRDEVLRVKEGFTEISFRRYRSTSCKNFPSKPLAMGDTTELRRGSVYQSSNELFKELREPHGRKDTKAKLELSRSSDASFSFRVVDSSRKASTEKRPNKTVLNGQKSSVEPCTSGNFIDICLKSGIKDRAVVLDSADDVASPLNECSNEHKVRLPKLHSSKVDSLETSCNKDSSRVRKMFDPFVKSKSQRSPLGYIGESVVCTEKPGKNNERCRSMLSDYSNIHKRSNLCPPPVVSKDYTSVLRSSPVHLHCRLKMESKHGLPVFQFVTDSPEEVYGAKTWKSDNGSTWIYTFSSAGSRKRSSASVRGLNEVSKESLLLAQMQVTCNMCSEVRKKGQDPETLMVNEFVLYDIAQARRSVSTKEDQSLPLDMVNNASKNSVKPDSELRNNSMSGDGSDTMKQRTSQLKRTSQSYDLEASNGTNPWSAADLHPDLEIAAIIIQDTIEKRESLKYRRGDKRLLEKTNLLGLSPIEEEKKELLGSRVSEKLKVVIPRGNHGLPSTKNLGPSPLIQRWRSGGGCDCGGWDMACPLMVLGNPRISCSHDQPLVDNQHPLQLVVQGAKEHLPALYMSFVEEGHYDVHFHAQLSTLQAFSICVAILHNTEVSDSYRNGENVQQFSHCNSLKMLIDDDVQFLVEAVTEEEEKNVPKLMKEAATALQSYMPNPPFSPISRV
ncbi:PREDICTED: uncharacterized protein LOC104737143 [Camelina sativa]|uniref:Uncharacterized protein LOC104737143 n=1 Tax=Camelina sativa TaxID=90675 RepID=A0ABM0VFX0_CAMSA|nr:PREDICTED: uncharacterized protein LOC104737143 [Camelina sativa]XP_010455554.1 PREDICTED: uncharacterized protein LOC104737143 [Camelina sativa]XP_010455555.1 PREDICTED: uncharacterized protein LOC104737143 [Camelina sativa]